MKIAFRNFLTTLKRYKTASVLNIAGLTLAFMALYILISQVMYDVRYNRSIDDYARVYMACTYNSEDAYSYNQVPRLPLEQSIEACPEVEAGGVIDEFSISYGKIWVRRHDNSLDSFSEDVFRMSLPVLDVFSFKSVEGDLRALERPYTLIVSESMAEKLGVAVGDFILLGEGQTSIDIRPEREYQIVGIFEDFAPNTLMNGKHLLCNIGEDGISLEQCVDFSFMYFIKLREGASVDNFEQISTRFVSERFKEAAKTAYKREMEFNQTIKLMPIDEIYYNDITFENQEQGDKKRLMIMLSIAVVILIMAFINFVNFFFALIPIRLRTVNVSKVFGASVGELRWSFLFEAIGLVMCAILLTAYIAIAFIDFPLNGYVTCSLNPFENLPALGIILAIGVVMAVVAAIYPSWYITSFSPSLAAKGRFAGSLKGRALRTVLICVQFTASIILIITTLFFALQYRYMINYDLGFDTENLITFTSPYEIAKRGDVFIDELRKHPSVKDVTASQGSFFNEHGFALNWRLNSGEDVKIYRRMVYPNFFEVMGIDILEGEYINDNERFGGYGIKKNKIVVNRRASEMFGMKIGSEPVFDEKGVVGIVEDVRFHPVNQAVEPLMYMCAGRQENYNVFYVRLQPSANKQEMVQYINRVARNLVSQSEQIDVADFSNVVVHEYEKTKRTMVIVGAFALVAIAISLMGVFGIVLFETQHRRREIAIRKVFGSTTSELLWLLNSRYAKIVCACFVVAAPVAWWIVNRWLQQFASRIPIYWWVFVVAFVIVMGITIGLVTLRSWHAANENPADVVKSE